jgi:hypothetical protein
MIVALDDKEYAGKDQPEREECFVTFRPICWIKPDSFTTLGSSRNRLATIASLKAFARILA